MMHREAIELYRLQPVAKLHIADEIFYVAVSDAGIAAEECCIYAFLVGRQIVHLGSSKGRLAKRLRAWQNDISRALQGRKSPAPQIEADKWRALLLEYGVATIYARPGTIVETPVGRISTYLNEECALIERYRPIINRSWR